ncbi:hypothetical protein [Fodinicola feengrottensis]|uniref:hypothetical protein n=1 Tax=Fodinicola feengrottensis TaxID=435914 RepID=UPI00244141D3|nr:hypothetical protein [Fodinicola feengrottensis]
MSRGGQAHGLFPVQGFTDDLDVVGVLQQCAKARSDEGLVVGEKNSDHLVAFSAGGVR